ncbi:MAG: (Fe-S)-binding protein [Acidobacteriota bacterium]
MLNGSEIMLFIFVLSLAFFAFFDPLILKIKLLAIGKKEKRFDRIGKRFLSSSFRTFSQTCTLKERLITGLMHFFVFWAFVLFLLATTNHLIEGFIKNFFIFGNYKVGFLFTLLIDSLAFLVLLSCGYFAVRRYIFKPEGLTVPSPESATVLFFLYTAMVTYLLFEGMKISSGDPVRGAYLGEIISSQIFSGNNSQFLLHFLWWAHILTIMGFGIYIPRSKHMHLLAGPINLFFQNLEPMGAIKPIDFENEERFGIKYIEDFTWKDQLDSYACAECGRCQDFCPAYNSEKPLSPKDIIVKIKKDLLPQAEFLLTKKNGEFSRPLMERTFFHDEIWSCTTCAACEVTCPMMNEHISKIIGLRQSEVLMEGRFPPELIPAFKNLETNFNPWGVGFTSRKDWTEGMNVKTFAEKGDAEYLLWIGCAGSYDERNKKISKAMVRILAKAGVDFAILGNEEKCCGDPARRTGNEYLFQNLCQENIKTFNKYRIKKIITFCPHGYNTLKNEYPQFGGNHEVFHHTEFISKLLSEGRLSIPQTSQRNQRSQINQINGKNERNQIDEINQTDYITYHDPCYLGRHNEIYDIPRELIKKFSKEPLREMKHYKFHSLCCGAGGGRMWMEEKIGKRINHMRAEEAIESKADTIITACPFCMTMLSDAMKDKGIENISILDLAEFISKTD